MGKNKECYLTQLIDKDGVFNAKGLKGFATQVKLKKCGTSYAVVSIMGLQSSGKSTLLNHLFGTKFREMDACKGRSQTTQGIWLARGVGIKPCTLVLDLEGVDGGERGVDDTAFERQSALFALAVSHVVLINIWYHNIGCEQAANKPLLKTLFCDMLQLFSPRRTTLMFVIRDKTRIPFEILEANLREGVQKIWESVPKSQAHDGSLLSEFFNVEVVALSSYKENKEQFKEQVTNLRQRFFNSTAPGGLAGDIRDVVPASGFSFSVQKIWEQIKENKDLNLPFHMVLVATVRCEETAKEKYSNFAENEEWLIMKEDAQSGLVPGFGRKLGTILNACLSGYDLETTYFDESVRLAKRAQLQEKLLQDVQPTFHSIMGHLRSGTLGKFKEAFDKALNEGKAFSSTARSLSRLFMVMFEEGYTDAVIEQANWVTSNARKKLLRDIEEHIASVREAKLLELTKEYKQKLIEALSGRLEALLEGADDETWPSIRILLRRETKSAVSRFSNALLGFDLDKQAKKKMLAGLLDYARGVVESKAKEEARRVSSRMEERFSRLFSLDAESMPRVWDEKEDISAIAMTARSASLKMLSVMAAIRLDDISDGIEDTLKVALLEQQGSGTRSDRNYTTVDPLASRTWEEIPSSRTLITPFQCKSLWKQFMGDTECMVNQAISAQRAYEENMQKAFNQGAGTGVAAAAAAAAAAAVIKAVIPVAGAVLGFLVRYTRRG